jgi:hypothetical protein
MRRISSSAVPGRVSEKSPDHEDPTDSHLGKSPVAVSKYAEKEGVRQCQGSDKHETSMRQALLFKQRQKALTCL